MSDSCNVSSIPYNQDQTESKPEVSCVIPAIHTVVDVMIRASYKGDQRKLAAFANVKVEGTLHEGHEVLKMAAVPALQKARL